MKLAASKIAVSTLFTLFMVLAARVLSDSFVRQCGDVRVYFSADNRSTEVACCMQNPRQCRWVFAGDPQANISYRVQQTGLVLSWQPGRDQGSDLFGRYTCFDQMNDTVEEIDFLPGGEGGCVLCGCGICWLLQIIVHNWLSIWQISKLHRSLMCMCVLWFK